MKEREKKKRRSEETLVLLFSHLQWAVTFDCHLGCSGASCPAFAAFPFDIHTLS
jgi:hypothetical protein